MNQLTTNSSATSLLPFEVVQDAQVEAAKQDASGGGSYLPFVKLVSSNSRIAKLKAADGRIAGGNYMLGVGSDSAEDLSDTVDVIVITARPCAVDTGAEPVVRSYDRESPEYKDIASRSDTPDSGCMYGPEILLWLGEKQCFATMHLNSKSARNASSKVIAQMGKAAQLGSRLAEGSGYSWEVLTCKALTAFHYDSPEADALTEVLAKFKNPVKQALPAPVDTSNQSDDR